MTGQPQLLSVQRRYWELIASGVSSEDAGVAVGVSATCGGKWFRRFGGVNPRWLAPQGQKRPRLSADEREQIMIGTAQGESIRSMAARLGRAPSTVMREIANNGVMRGYVGRYRSRYRFGARRAGVDAKSGYSARIAQLRSEQRARRPKIGKLGRCPALRDQVQAWLVKKYSPEQIAGMLATTYSDRPEMQVSHETIYKALYVQGRGELRRELTKCLRTGRALRKPRARVGARSGCGRIPGMVNISERPAEAADRAVPGHWEGDLILGKNQHSQIGTLVERSTGFVQLLHLPARRDPETVADAMIATIKTLPQALRRSLTWDQGHEMLRHARISIDAGIDIYFCDPHSPWQRGSNENTNGLLRQYFPKGTDLSVHSADYLAEVAAELNERPRKRFGWDSPAQVLNRLLSNPPQTTVATKP
ncbi:IS30 family transposase [Mycobacterium intracellulare]|jgi:IS30 family transposase|nr:MULTISPECIES: IS30 family transposase [Mycobacterium avium complex (MAC)]MEE3802618.1 IS30 family transposase [Mycobacterium intracellulare]UGT96133.1 IS30 family transposase [Mycobacterium intracellulare]UGT97684.1 IS30 family transposase [Mycobacterium intracellulare]UGT98620.1 IS30 family transposase [Mycobacterium intracellulare]UGU05323.1 IS30 family transposase [Mycobacterium intracellulare subsp. intracellulare]